MRRRFPLWFASWLPVAVLALAMALVPVARADAPATDGQRGDLKVTVDNIEPGPGAIRVALYATPDSFRHEDRALAVVSLPATATSVTADFPDLAPGRYAVLAYHDANDNHKLDLILGMFPDEGWGLSNDPAVLGPPRFDPSAFVVGAGVTAQSVHLHY